MQVMTAHEKILKLKETEKLTTFQLFERAYKEVFKEGVPTHVIMRQANEFDRISSMPPYIHSWFRMLEQEPTRLPAPEFRSIIRV